MPSRHVIFLFYSFFISSMEKHKLLLHACHSPFSLEHSKGETRKESAHRGRFQELFVFSGRFLCGGFLGCGLFLSRGLLGSLLRLGLFGLLLCRLFLGGAIEVRTKLPRATLRGNDNHGSATAFAYFLRCRKLAILRKRIARFAFIVVLAADEALQRSAQ